MRQTWFIFLRAASIAERPSALRSSCMQLHTSLKGLGLEFHFRLALGKWPVTLGWSVVFMVIPLTSTFCNSLLSSGKHDLVWNGGKRNTLRPHPGVFKLSDNAEVTINARYKHAPFRKINFTCPMNACTSGEIPIRYGWHRVFQTNIDCSFENAQYTCGHCMMTMDKLSCIICDPVTNTPHKCRQQQLF